LLIVVEKVRGYKTERQLGLGTEIAHLEITSQANLSAFADDVISVTRANKIDFKQGTDVEIKIS